MLLACVHFEGGVLRGVENHGVRDLPFRTKSFALFVTLLLPVQGCSRWLRTPHLLLYDFYLACMHSRIVDSKGERHHWQSKLIVSTCDLSPRGLINVNRILRSSDDVLRFFTIREKNSGIDKVRSRKRSNPFVYGKHTTGSNVGK